MRTCISRSFLLRRRRSLCWSLNREIPGTSKVCKVSFTKLSRFSASICAFIDKETIHDRFPLPHEGIAVLDREKANASGGNEFVPILVVKTNPQGAFRRQVQENLQEGKPAIGRFRLNDHVLVVRPVEHMSYDRLGHPLRKR